MGLRKRILFSFLAVIAISIAQMLHTITGMGQISGFAGRFPAANSAATRFETLAHQAGKLQASLSTALLLQSTRRPLELALPGTGERSSSRRQAMQARYDSALQARQSAWKTHQAELERTVALLTEAAGASSAAGVDSFAAGGDLSLEDYRRSIDKLSSMLQAMHADEESIDREVLILVQLFQDRDELARLVLRVQSLWAVLKYNPAEDPALLSDTLVEFGRLVSLSASPVSEGGNLAERVTGLQSLLTGYQGRRAELGGYGGDALLASAYAQLDRFRVAALARAGASREAVQATGVELANAVNSQRTMAFVVGLLGIVIGSMMAVLLTREIIKPIEEFRNAADRVSRGDPNVQLPDPTTQDEIAELSKSFQRMLNSLRALMAQDMDDESAV